MRAWGAPVLVGLAVTLFFAPLLFGGVLFQKDALIYTLPEKATLRAYLEAGRLPTIDPYVLSGTPLLENVVAGAIYPLNGLLLVGEDVFTGNAVFVWFHFLLAGLGMLWFLAEGLRVPTWVALTGALAWSLGGSLWSMTPLSFFAFGAWLPLFGLGLVRGVFQGRRLLDRWLLLAATALTAMLLCGNLQEAYVIVLLSGGALCSWLFSRGERREAGRALARFALVLAAASGLAAPQLVPTVRAARASYRSAGLELVEAQDWSFPIQRIPEYVVPFRYGVRDGHGLWSQRFYRESRPAPVGPRAGVSPWSDSIFLGVPLIVAALVALARSRRQPVLPWAVLLGVTFITALGKATPVYRLWYELVPGFETFRHPEKLLVLAGFCLVVLGALGWEMASRTPALRSWIVRVAVTLLAVIAVSTVWTLTRPLTVFQDGGSAWDLPRIRTWVGWQSGLSGVALLAVVLLARRGRALPIAVPLLTFAHLFLCSRMTTWTIDADLVRGMRNVVAREELALDDARVVVDLPRVPTLDPFDYEDRAGTARRIDDPYALYKLSEVNTLASNSGGLFEVPVTTGFSPTARRGYVELLGNVPPQVSSELLGGRYVVTGVGDPAALPEHMRPVGRSGVLLENTRALPRVSLHREVSSATRREAFERRLLPPEQRAPLVAVTARDGTFLAPPDLVFGSHPRPPTIRRSRPGELVVACPDPGWLVIRDGHLDGWRCRADDGGALPVHRADGVAMAVRNERAGATLTFTYRPPGFRTGLAIAATTVAALIACAVSGAVRRPG